MMMTELQNRELTVEHACAEAYRSVFASPYPARTTVQAVLRGIEIGVDCIAFAGDPDTAENAMRSHIRRTRALLDGGETS
jgi:hypothetical protein